MKHLYKRFTAILLTLFLSLSVYSQSYSLSKEELTKIENSITIAEQTIIELDAQLKIANEQLMKQEKQLKKSKEINKVLAILSIGLASSIAINAAITSTISR